MPNSISIELFFKIDSISLIAYNKFLHLVGIFVIGVDLEIFTELPINPLVTESVFLPSS